MNSFNSHTFILKRKLHFLGCCEVLLVSLRAPTISLETIWDPLAFEYCSNDFAESLVADDGLIFDSKFTFYPVGGSSIKTFFLDDPVPDAVPIPSKGLGFTRIPVVGCWVLANISPLRSVSFF
jgi:hypothetical protein